MDRITLLRKYLTKEQLGIEIGPWFAPIAPKRDGFRCLVMDVFDTETLRTRAAADPNVTHDVGDIEEVDLVGSSTELDEVAGRRHALGSFDYVVSSHNFEHVPNPIRFLQACSRVLRPGGFITMAIPDHRMCFDHYRPLTMLTDWLGAYLDKRDRPTPLQIFHQFAHLAAYADGDKQQGSFPSDWVTEKAVTSTDVQDFYQDLLRRIAAPANEYTDVHCSAMTPASFEMLMADCIHLRLLPLEIVEIAAFEHEFHAHLRVVPEVRETDAAAHRIARDRLLRRTKDEAAMMSGHYRALRAERDALDARAKRLEDDLVARDAQIDALDARIAALQASHSWRATAPLRWLSTSVRQRGLMRADGRAYRGGA